MMFLSLRPLRFSALVLPVLVSSATGGNNRVRVNADPVHANPASAGFVVLGAWIRLMSHSSDEREALMGDMRIKARQNGFCQGQGLGIAR